MQVRLPIYSSLANHCRDLGEPCTLWERAHLCQMPGISKQEYNVVTDLNYQGRGFIIRHGDYEMRVATAGKVSRDC